MANIDNSNQYNRFKHALKIWLPHAKITYLSEKEEKKHTEYCVEQLKTYYLNIELHKDDEESDIQIIQICAMTKHGYFIICGKTYVWPWKEVYCQNWIYKLKSGIEVWSCELDKPWELYKGRLKVIIHQNTICVEGQYQKGRVSLLQFMEYYNIEDLMNKSLKNYSIDEDKYESLLNGPWKNKKNNPFENHPFLPHLKSMSSKSIFLSLMIVNLLNSDIPYANTNDINTKRIIGVEWLIGHLCSRIENKAGSYMIKRIHSQGQLINLASYFERISHLTRVIRGSSAYGNHEKREYHKSHIGVYCLYRSSEGENIGLNVDLVSDVKITLPPHKYDTSNCSNGVIDCESNQICSPQSKFWKWNNGGRVMKGNNSSKGYVAKQIVFARHMPPVRSSYATTHIRQANKLIYPQKPIITPKDSNTILINGYNAIVVVSGYNGWNIEDAIVVNESFIKRGGLQSIHKKITIVKKKGKEIWKNPIHEVRKKIKESDICFTKSINNIDNNIRGCHGTVVKSYETQNNSASILELEYIHSPEIGDKLSTRSGQKGVIGYMEEVQNMPYTINGIVPDIIINPAHMPSRMTISQMLESYFGTEAIVKANLRHDNLCEKELSQLDKNSGKSRFICGKSGKKLDNPLFVGTVFYMALSHMVHKKVKARNIGPVVKITNQPIKGGKYGGLRIGEMERDSIMARNAMSVLKERLQTSSDMIKVRVCKSCGWLEPEIICCQNHNWIDVNMSKTTRLTLMEMYSLKIFPKLHF